MTAHLWGRHPAFLGVDMQVGILRGCAGQRQQAADAALLSMYDRVAALQAKARAQGLPVIHIQHEGPPGHRLDPRGSGWNLHPAVSAVAGDVIIAKRHCDPFFETSLLDVLTSLSVRSLVVAGCMTQYCIDTTCRRAVSLGFDVTLVADGHMNGGSAALNFEQVIVHHNHILVAIDAGEASLQVQPTQALL